MKTFQGLQLREDSQGNNITNNTKADFPAYMVIPAVVTQASSNTDSEY